MHEGVSCVEHIAGVGHHTVDYDNVPSVVFSHPPIGTVGMTENEAHAQYGNDVTVYSSDFMPMRHALSEHKSATAMKLVCAEPNSA